MLLVCAETVIKGCPTANKYNTACWNRTAFFMLEPSLGTVMPIGVSWETLAQKNYVHFTLLHHTQSLKKFILTAPPL